jgi:flagella basal body P-ring formation protein FlgA
MSRHSFWLRALSLLLLATAACSLAAQPAEIPSPAAASAPSDALLADLTRAITNHFHVTGKLQLDPVQVWGFPGIPSGTKPRLVITEYPAALSPYMLVRCKLETSVTPLASWSISLRAQLWGSAWTAQEPIQVGDPFDPTVLTLQRCDLLRQHDALPATFNDRDYIFARSVPANRTLIWQDVVRRPLVRRGETVDVSAIDGALTVTVKALAIQNGGRGDLVLVRNLDSNKEFTGVVVDKNQVEVRF